ncbi:hypothetical protein MVEN_02419300 [Mycena venus]|uniref:Fungal-type protein kinase domain-containing protein n=1 Tax=Mycena venus TaxID=2733690 RepID=A0A8H6WY49_9AGAR|nr:hypothetical protein MVEN_02419300 [Mycena venus]
MCTSWIPGTQRSRHEGYLVRRPNLRDLCQEHGRRRRARAPPLKPDLGGIKDRYYRKTTLYWSPPDGSEKSRMQVPVEVKSNWTKLITQAATYGRSLFSAAPSRVFSLVIAINHEEKNLRFLLFHRGGLTTHAPLRLDQWAGRRDTLRVIMTLLLWSEPQHAGFVSTSNDLCYLLPLSSDSYMEASVTKVVHDSICIRGRATRVCQLSCHSPDPPTATSEMTISPTSLEPTAVTQASSCRSSRLKASTTPSAPTSLPNLKTNVSMSPRSKGSDIQAPECDQNSTELESLPIHPHHPTYGLTWNRPTIFIEGQGTVKAGQNVILKTSWQPDSRKDTERTMYKSVAGAFGTPAVFCSYEGAHPNGEPISNRLLVPTNKEVEDDRTLHYDIFADDDGTSLPEVRTLCCTIFTTIGKSLTEAKSANELCMALVHALLGWFSYYQSGYIQRDISVGNVLLVMGEAVSVKPFSVDEGLLTPLSVSSLDATPSCMSIENSEPVQIAKDIMGLVDRLEVATRFTAFATDGDMAADWRTYFSDVRSQIKSGTPEFMSVELHRAMNEDRDYVHSPVDDIQSFFWLAAWAVLFNVNSRERSDVEVKWRRNLASGTVAAKSDFVVELITCDLDDGHSVLGTQVLPLLMLWWQKQQILAGDWQRSVAAKARKLQEKADIPNFYLQHLHSYALRGVKEFLELIVQHQQVLLSYGPLA